MKLVKNQGFFKLALIASVVSLSFSAPSFAKEDSDIEKVRSLFDGADSKTIVQDHNQRISNIEYEMTQLQSLINKYGSLSQRVDRQFSNDRQRKEMAEQLKKRLDSYWKIYAQLEEVRNELVKNKPSFKYQ